MFYTDENLTLVELPIKNTACFPPTPKYEISLFNDRGVSWSRTDSSSLSLSSSESSGFLKNINRGYNVICFCDQFLSKIN